LRYVPHDPESHQTIMKSDLSKSGWVTDPASGLDVVDGLLGCEAGNDFADPDASGVDILIDPANPCSSRRTNDDRLIERRDEPAEPSAS
jgi:hypothetical protein